jgi:hypothetical protein
MKIFISWSGKRSKYIAETLCNWLEQVLQAVEPWISTDIEKGKRWSFEIANKLKESKVVIICLTKDNLESNWLHFEAGAVANNEDSYVCTFLFDISEANIKEPLSQFQNTKNEETDILKLLNTINNKIGKTGGKSLKETSLESVFRTFYPQLKERLEKTPESSDKDVDPRSDREIFEESLQILRSIQTSTINSSFFTTTDLNEILDFWIETYSKNRKIDYSSLGLLGHEDDIVKFINKIPEISKIFGTGDILKRRIKARIEELLPF